MSAFDPAIASSLLRAVQVRRPRVHCLTNHVARAFTANVLLALGAVPSMSADADEVGAFVSGADALLVNLGTLDPAMRLAIGRAVDAARARDIPIIVDPVFADRSEQRASYARTLLDQGPAALRCNADEAAALGAAVLDVAEEAGAITVLTGEVDRIRGGGRIAMIEGGDALMAKVTAMGCALGGVIAAFLSAGGDRFDAVASACLLFKRAGAAAGARSAGPGSFVPAFLDDLHAASAGGQLPTDKQS